MGVRIRVDGTMVLAGLVLGGALYLYYKRKQIVEAVNPMSQKNLANRTFNAATSQYFSAKTGVPGETYGTYCAAHQDEIKCAPFRIASSILGD